MRGVRRRHRAWEGRGEPLSADGPLWRAGASVLLVAAVVLGACSDDRRLERDLHASDPETRATAVRRLVRKDRAKAIPVLTKMLEDRDARVRVEAAEGLGQLKAVGAAKALGALLRDTDSRVRLAAVGALGGLGLAVAEDYLVDAVTDSNRLVRRAARNRLSDLGVPRPEQQRRVATRRLVRHRRDLVERLPERRLAAVKALGRCGRPEVVADLEKLTSDPYVTVAEEAAEALGSVGSAEAVAALERLASRSADGRRLAARGIKALFAGFHPPGRRLAHRLLTDADLGLRRAALELVLHPSERAFRPAADRLCRCLEGVEAEVAVPMAKSLSEAGVPCPRRTAQESGGGLHPWDVLASITRPPPLDPREREWVVTQLGQEGAVPDAVALTVAAARGDEALRRLAVARVQRSHRHLLEASERWLDEGAWKRLADLRTAPAGGPLLSPEPPTPTPARPGAANPTRAKREKRLHQLLDRFPDRSEMRDDELLPPTVDASGFVSALGLVAALDEAHPWLLELTARGPRRIRLAAWVGLGQKGCQDVPCRAAVVRALDEGDPELRVAAIGAVAKPDGALVDRLVPLLGDADARVRAAAAAALGRSRHDKAWPALLAAFRKSREPHLVEAFGILGDPRAERVLLARLREEQDPLIAGERLLVIEAIGRVGSAAATERLVAELEQSEPALRRGAALALGRLGDRRAVGPLTVCAEDFYWAVRGACVQALTEVRARERATP